MKRKCRNIPLTGFFEDFREYENVNVKLYADEAVFTKLLKFLLEEDENGKKIRRDRFRKILIEILNFRYNKDLYDKPRLSSKSKNVTIMKFKSHRGHNWRILCKEMNYNGKKIVMITLIDKKTQEIGKKQKTTMEAIGAYDYEF